MQIWSFSCNPDTQSHMIIILLLWFKAESVVWAKCLCPCTTRARHLNDSGFYVIMMNTNQSKNIQRKCLFVFNIYFKKLQYRTHLASFPGINKLTNLLVISNFLLVIFKSVISKYMWRNKFMSTCEIVLRLTPLNAFDYRSTVGLVMAWCRQATSHCLSHLLTQISGTKWRH